MTPDRQLERLTIIQSEWQRGNCGPIQAANAALHEARKALAWLTAEIERLEKRNERS